MIFSMDKIWDGAAILAAMEMKLKLSILDVFRNEIWDRVLNGVGKELMN